MIIFSLCHDCANYVVNGELSEDRSAETETAMMSALGTIRAKHGYLSALAVKPGENHFRCEACGSRAFGEVCEFATSEEIPASLAEFIAGYSEALYWSSTVTNYAGEDVPADQYTPSVAAAARCHSDCEAFMSGNAEAVAVAAEVYGYGHAGHDFALTRNGHGAGFWDGDLPAELAERLTAAARAAGEVSLYLDDDENVSIEGA